MKKYFNILLCVLLLIYLKGCGEISIDHALENFNSGSVPYISVDEMEKYQPEFILDTRSEEEYNVSRIPGSFWVGYDSFSIDKVDSLITNKDRRIVVYCSVGIRSEDIGEQLLNNDYTEVKNLYGGIFQWKNQGMTVVDSAGNQTQNVHAYSKFWGRLLTEANKVY